MREPLDKENSRPTGVKIVEKRRMKYLREEIGTEVYIAGKLVIMRRMKWAGHALNERQEIAEKR